MTDIAARADASLVLDRLARAGLAAYGVVHVLVAALAVRLVFGTAEGPAGQRGAMEAVARQPFGRLLVWAVAIGLVCLVVWCVGEGLVGFRDHDGAVRVRKRLASAVKAVVFAALCASAVKIAAGGAAGPSAADAWTTRLIDLPAGQLIVDLLGVAVVAAGCYLVWFGVRSKARQKLDDESCRGRTRAALVWFGNVGYAAKGISVALIGGLVLYAGLTREPERSGGLGRALLTVVHQPYGRPLLLAVALGLGCFGLFCLARARHLDR